MNVDYFSSIFLGTFLLEDLALAGALTLVNDQKLDGMTAFMACFLGISIGDLLLYFFGRAASLFNLEDRFTFIKGVRRKYSKMYGSNLLTYSVILCRFIPGTRVPTYVIAGLFHYSFWTFFLITIITVGGWVGLLS